MNASINAAFRDLKTTYKYVIQYAAGTYWNSLNNNIELDNCFLLFFSQTVSTSNFNSK